MAHHCNVRTVLLNSSRLEKSDVPNPRCFSCPESTYRHLSTYLSPWGEGRQRLLEGVELS